MGAKLSSNVAELSDEQRRVLESVIGQPLRSDQVLHWFVSSSGSQPAAAEAARAGLEEIFSKVDRHLDQRGVSQAEFDAVVDEAVEHVRSHPDE